MCGAEDGSVEVRPDAHHLLCYDTVSPGVLAGAQGPHGWLTDERRTHDVCMMDVSYEFFRDKSQFMCTKVRIS